MTKIKFKIILRVGNDFSKIFTTEIKISATCRDQKISLTLFLFWYLLCSSTFWSWNFKLCKFERILVKFSSLLVKCAVFLSSLMFLQYIYAVVLLPKKKCICVVLHRFNKFVVVNSIVPVLTHDWFFGGCIIYVYCYMITDKSSYGT